METQKKTAIAPPITPKQHQARLRQIVKRLVIDYGYLEQVISESPDYCSHERAIASCLDAAIDTINERLQRQPN
jgi:hypothetical protein